MQRIAVLYISFVCLLFLQAGDLHSHFCLDGQEPAVSLHYENLNGHPQHDDDEAAHEDFESEVSTAVILAKAKSTANSIIVSFHRDVFTVLPRPVVPVVHTAEIHTHSDPSVTLPPLRAPPVIA